MSNTQRFLLSVGLACASVGWVTASPSDPYAEEVRAGKEEIYVFRTTRMASARGSTPGCSAAPFESAREDRYDLWSLELRTKDARIVKTHEKAVGEFLACFGTPAPNQPLPMYASGTLAHITWRGTGECRAVGSQPPVRSVVAFNCELNLTDLPARYAGGFLVSSTAAPVTGRDQPPTAHVPGYLSTSVVTLRLWTVPDARTAPQIPQHQDHGP